MYLSIVHSYAKFYWQCAYIIVRHIFVAGLVSITPPKSRTYEFVLFSVKLFYCCLKARISGCCYVKYANSALSHLQIRQQLWKKQTISASKAFKEVFSHSSYNNTHKMYFGVTSLCGYTQQTKAPIIKWWSLPMSFIQSGTTFSLSSSAFFLNILFSK